MLDASGEGVLGASTVPVIASTAAPPDEQAARTNAAATAIRSMGRNVMQVQKRWRHENFVFDGTGKVTRDQ
jgi:hypothetical protein